MPNIYKPRKKKMRNDDYYDIERRKIYNSKRWRKTRKWKFVCDPLCEMCKKEGRITPAEDIHHVISFMSTDNLEYRERLAYDYDNLMSLCKKCHQKIHNSNFI